jgi:hypothetical protein
MSSIYAIVFEDGTEVFIRANAVEEAIATIREFLNNPDPRIFNVSWVGESEDLSLMQCVAGAAPPPRHSRRH